MNKINTPKSGVNLSQAIRYSIAFVVMTISFCSSAQTVGTIGFGDVSYQAAKQTLWADQDVVKEVVSSLNNALVRTRKFTVLNKTQVENRLSDQGLTLGGFYSKEYKSTELLQAGLDYILTADITEFSVPKKSRSDAAASVGIVFTLLGVADVTSDFDSKVIVSSAVDLPGITKLDSTVLMKKAIKRAADEMVDRIVTTLHPVRVMQISDEGVITLNYGNGFLKPDDLILVYAKDHELDFDEKGRIVGEPIAKLKITSTQTKFSNAQAIDGFTLLEKGLVGQMMVRRQ